MHDRIRNTTLVAIAIGVWALVLDGTNLVPSARAQAQPRRVIEYSMWGVSVHQAAQIVPTLNQHGRAGWRVAGMMMNEGASSNEVLFLFERER